MMPTGNSSAFRDDLPERTFEGKRSKEGGGVIRDALSCVRIPPPLSSGAVSCRLLLSNLSSVCSLPSAASRFRLFAAETSTR